MDASRPASFSDPEIPAPQPPDASSGGFFARIFVRSIERSKVRSIFSYAAQQVLDLVYPPSCCACNAAVQQNGFLCPSCWTRLTLIERPFCERSGTPFAQDLGPGLISPQALADPPVWGRARAVAVYEDGPARRLVHALKYGDRLDLAGPMGLWMARAGAELLTDADALAPIPLHRGRLFQRRFNQAAALAHAVSAASGVACEPLLLARRRATPPQVGLSRAQRAQNVQGVFHAPEPARVHGRRIVLIDDVMTSGATCNAAARALLRAGAARVDALAFGRVVSGF
jgi:ComF family protein